MNPLNASANFIAILSVTSNNLFLQLLKMKKSLPLIGLLLLGFLFFVPRSINAQDPANNSELQKMADEDQQSRMKKDINWVLLNKEDSVRRVRVFELIEKDQLKTGKDYLNAGIIFQHGNDTLASSMAVKSFGKALQLDSTLNRWWYAAAVDRDLMRRGLPQIYGTQYRGDGKGRFYRYQIDTTKVSDAERKYYRVETLAEQVEKERTMNLKSIPDYYKTSDIDKTITLIRSEYKKGKQSAYNVNEEVINTFGYQLLEGGKEAEALKIFKLNTELYPRGYNTFDSYGEILLKMGKKKEAKAAYEKSLKLNPDNENAKEVLKNL